jgi:type VI secretion system protein VasD
MTITARLLLTGLLAYALSGCFGPGPQPADVARQPTVVLINVSASPRLNPDTDGRPSPIVIHLFELGRLSLFESLDFFALLAEGSSGLGREQLGREQVIIKPGETVFVKRQLLPDTKYLGVAAAFRDIEHARWRASVQPMPYAMTQINIRLEALAVTIDSAVDKQPRP